MEESMRIILIVAAIVALALPAHAQGMSGGKHRRGASAPTSEADQQKRKAADAAYKAALDKIPNQTQKPDPWRNAR
jgi:hypothetical protein